MVEPVRLVIWDLDETFWRGTLTEGGIKYRQDAHDIVIALARRGIISVICSKNDEASVLPVLEQYGIADYFVFPSINWDPKGPRIAALIEAVQLRPETVLFIDDNPMNLREALHYTPNLQTSDETIIPDILDNPLFKGKDDSALTRLNQYKLLERRKQDETAAIRATGSQTEFLRNSHIRIRFEYDLEPHIDRVVELINRTNQLNFIKARLPEDLQAARDAARQLIASYDLHAGLVRVIDDYGDYGFCGFFALRTHGTTRRMVQFAFSCRVLGMGVEQFLYAHLGFPDIQIMGEVLSTLDRAAPPVDWIEIETTSDGEDARATAFPVEHMLIRGGCDLTAVGHYLANSVRHLTTELNTVRHGMMIRLDHSSILRLAAEGVDEATMKSLRAIGYRPEDFETALFSLPPGSTAVLSFAVDAFLVTYRHRTLGFRVAFWNPDPGAGGNTDMTLPDQAVLDRLAGNHPATAAAWEMVTKFNFEGLTAERQFKENLKIILARIPPATRVIVLGPNDHYIRDGKRTHSQAHTDQNRWIKDAIRDFSNAEYVSVRDFISREDEVLDNVDHFDRSVYHRIYQGLLARALAGAALAEPALTEQS